MSMGRSQDRPEGGFATAPAAFWLAALQDLKDDHRETKLAPREQRGINNTLRSFFVGFISELDYYSKHPSPSLLSSLLFCQVMHSQYQSGYHSKRSLSQTSATTTSSHGSQCSNEKQHSRKTSNSISSKLFRARSKSPTPIEIPKARFRQSSSVSQPQDIPRSAPGNSYFDQNHRSTSPVQMSPDSSAPRSPKPDYSTKRASTPTRKNSDDYRRRSGTVNHCGRHSNDWLFGGFSVRDTVRDGIGKLRHHDEES